MALIDIEAEYAALLQFIHLSPFALARIDEDGHIDLLNARGASLLMQSIDTIELDNLFDLLDPVAPELRAMVRDFDAERGLICEGHRIVFERDVGDLQVLALTMRKLGPGHIIVALSDISKVDAAHRARQLLLDHISEGLLTVRRDGRLMAECSVALVQWLGSPKEQMFFWDYIAPTDAGFAASLRSLWWMFTEGALPYEVALHEFPQRLHARGIPLGFSYRPVLQRGKLSHLLVVVRDLSAELEKERLDAEKKDLLDAVSMLTRDRARYRKFLLEANAMVAAITERAAGDPLRVARSLHTLRGNALFMGLSLFAQRCREIEERCATPEQALAEEDRQSLKAQWDALYGRLEPLVGEVAPGISLDAQEYQSLLQRLREGASNEEIIERLEARAIPSLKGHLLRFAAHARQLALALDKPNLRVRVDAAESLREPGDRLDVFWTYFVHALRNAVDHGVESEAERVAAGKRAEAELTLRAYRNDDFLSIELEDDGRGVDWSAIRDKARARGMAAESDADLMEALFRDGISSRDEISLTSGKGLGLGALRDAVVALGAELTVESVARRGTLLRVRFPWTTLSGA